jgi:hypothetical protein
MFLLLRCGRRLTGILGGGNKGLVFSVLVELVRDQAKYVLYIY